jgi:hypothetical protein
LQNLKNELESEFKRISQDYHQREERLKEIERQMKQVDDKRVNFLNLRQNVQQRFMTEMDV